MKNTEKITIKIEGKEWEEALEKSFKKNVKEKKVDGFRKGTVPKDIYLQKFGIESLFMDAVDEAVEVAYEKALKENDLKPVCQPNMDVKGIGKKNQIVEVSEGYARNFLIPKKIASIADNKAISEAKNSIINTIFLRSNFSFNKSLSLKLYLHRI